MFELGYELVCKIIIFRLAEKGRYLGCNCEVSYFGIDSLSTPKL
jgi:hypothetical protein